MKIVQMMLSPAIGGAEKSFVDLCNALATVEEVLVLIPRNTDYRELIRPGIRVHQLQSNPSRYNPLLYLEIARTVRRAAPDIVHTHSAKSSAIFHRLNRVLGHRHVATKRNSRRGRIFDRLPRVIAVSDAVAESIHGAPPQVIYNGIEPEQISIAPTNGPPFRIAAIGRLDPIKGFDRLIRAVDALDFDFRLEIYGDGPDRVRLTRLIDDLNLGRRVELCGFTSRVSEVLQTSSLLVISSLSEGFSRVLIEGLHYAPVAISTCVGGAERILTEPYLIMDEELGERITQIYHRYDEFVAGFQRLRAQHANRFTMQNVVRDHLSYYRSLL